jgi:hypothetical protein
MSKSPLQLLQNPIRFRMFLLKKLPAALFAGLRIEGASPEFCTVSVPYGWRTQNPFRSTYFACLAMAAEMSTGVLGLNAIYGRQPPVSMLIVAMESRYHKRATGLTFFTCSDGTLLQQTVSDALQSPDGASVKVYSKGTTRTGETIAEFWFTWSFRSKAIQSGT